MNFKSKIVIVEVVSALFILLFVYAALSKIEEYEKFKVELGKSPVLSSFAGLIAIIVPVIEICIALLLVLKRFQYVALYASFTLMVLFSVYIWFVLKFSSYVPCSCGGILQNMTWNQHLIFNGVFVILSCLAILIYPQNKNQELNAQ